MSYAARVIEAGVPREWLTFIFDIPLERRPDFRNRPYVYGSPYRPLPPGAPLHPFDAVWATIHSGRHSIIATKVPIDSSVLEAFDLVPVNQGAVGALVVATAGTPIELAHSNGEEAALIFLNPRRIWQLSFFTANIGPTGHAEAGNPYELAAQAVSMGYRRYASGVVDAIMETVQ